MKFTDAELLGMPWILTVSPRSLAAGGVEVTRRATGERRTAPIEEVEASFAGCVREAAESVIEPVRVFVTAVRQRHRRSDSSTAASSSAGCRRLTTRSVY